MYPAFIPGAYDRVAVDRLWEGKTVWWIISELVRFRGTIDHGKRPWDQHSVSKPYGSLPPNATAWSRIPKEKFVLWCAQPSCGTRPFNPTHFIQGTLLTFVLPLLGIKEDAMKNSSSTDWIHSIIGRVEQTLVALPKPEFSFYSTAFNFRPLNEVG